jgi:hypothetical protein
MPNVHLQLSRRRSDSRQSLRGCRLAASLGLIEAQCI